MENNKKNKKLLYLAVSDENNYDMDQNIYDSLTLIFPNIIRYYYRKRFKESGICKVQNEIIDIFMKEKPDFVFWPTSMYEIQEDTLLQIHKNGATIIAWFSDDHCRFDSYSKYLMPFIDYSITTDPVSYKKYKVLGAGCILSQWAANHRSYKKIDCKKQYEVSFIGRNISSRSRFIQKLENYGVHVDTFGDGFGGIINFEKMIFIINSSKINLNFSGSYVTTEIKQIKGRIFEIPMCGSFCLTEYVTGLENFFEIDKEIVCFNTIDEAANKIKYYLEHDNERETIARAGWMRAQSHHTWNKRMYEIFQIIRVPKGGDALEIANKYYESGLVKFSTPDFFNNFTPFQDLPNDTYFNYQITCNNTGQTINDGHTGTPDADIDAPEAWEMTTGLNDIVIAVIDEGVTM